MKHPLYLYYFPNSFELLLSINGFFKLTFEKYHQFENHILGILPIHQWSIFNNNLVEQKIQFVSFKINKREEIYGYYDNEFWDFVNIYFLGYK